MTCKCDEICQFDCTKAGECKAKIMQALRDNLELEKDRVIHYKEVLDANPNKPRS